MSRLMKETRLDLRGLLCPYPVLRAGKALRGIDLGDALILECTDPLTIIDIPHFVAQAGHALVEQHHENELFIFKVVRKR